MDPLCSPADRAKQRLGRSQKQLDIPLFIVTALRHQIKPLGHISGPPPPEGVTYTPLLDADQKATGTATT